MVLMESICLVLAGLSGTLPRGLKGSIMSSDEIHDAFANEPDFFSEPRVAHVQADLQMAYPDLNTKLHELAP